MCSCKRRKPLQIQGFERDCWINLDLSNKLFIFYHEEILESEAMKVALLILLKEMSSLATTRIIPMHQSAGCSLAQSLFNELSTAGTP